MAQARAAATYRVDASKLESLLAVLKEEYEKAKLSTFHRVCFALLRIAVYTIPIVLLAGWLMSDPALDDFFASELLLGAGCALVALAVASLVILVPLNVPLIRLAARQARLDRRLRRLLPKERSVLPVPRRSPRAEYWLRILAGGLLIVVALSVVLAATRGLDWWRVAVALVVLGGPASLILTGKRLPFRVVRVGFWVLAATIVVAAVFFVVAISSLGSSRAESRWLVLGIYALPVVLVLLLPGLLLLANRYIGWLQERMRLIEDVDLLRRSVERQRSPEGGQAGERDAGVVSLSSAEALRLERVQTTLIREQRAVAIESAQERGAAGFTTFKTLAARSQIEALAPRERVLVESMIGDLSVDPRPDGAIAEPAAPRYRLAAEGTGLEIHYEVDETLRQVRILSVGPPAGSGAGAARSEGASDV